MDHVTFAGKTIYCEASIDGNGPLSGTTCKLSIDRQDNLCVTDTETVKKLTERITITPVEGLAFSFAVKSGIVLAAGSTSW
jgi:hypothetical protein